MRTDDDHSPISAQDAKRLFADWKAAPAIVLAVSGGPDSIALMWLAARWRPAMTHGARRVAAPPPPGFWRAPPRAGGYRLLARAARADGATHILTAHTRDDQAETLLMRMLRGSGIAGLAAMARESERDGVLLARPPPGISQTPPLT